MVMARLTWVLAVAWLMVRATRKVVCAGQPSGWLIRRGLDPASMRGCVVVDQRAGGDGE